MPPTTPTPEHLRKADLDTLLGLLTTHTEQYASLVRQVGFSERSEEVKNVIVQIQVHIELRRKHLL